MEKAVRTDKGVEKDKTEGFTLIELLVALSILTIMIIAISPLFVFSLQSIAGSGEKSRGTVNSGGQVDIGISEGKTDSFTDIPVRFTGQNGDVTRVEGGNINQGDLSTFLANTESVTVSPAFLDEGYSGDGSAGYRTFNLTGKSTHFITGNTDLSIKDRDDMDVAYTSFTITNPRTASFRVDRTLRNYKSPFKVTLSTDIYVDGKLVRTETVKTSFTVNMPRIVAAASTGPVFLSGDLTSWVKPVDSVLGALNGAAWGDNKFVVTGNAGSIYFLTEGNNWRSASSGVGTALSKVRWMGSYFAAVGDGGRVITSADGVNWTAQNTSGIINNLNGIASNGSILVAVGDASTIKGNDNIIFTSGDNGQSWTPRTVKNQNGKNINVNLNDVIYDGRKFVCIGDDGLIASSEDGIGWLGIYDGNNDLYGLTYDGSTYVAVGNRTILTSSTGNADPAEWSPSPYSTNAVLRDIFKYGSRYISVGTSGSSGVILVSGENSTASWTQINPPVSGTTLLGIAGD